MKITSLALAAGLALSVAAPAVLAQPKAISPYPGGVDADIWVSAGQSNMHGAGLITKKYKANPKVMLFNLDNTWIPAVPPALRMFEAAGRVYKIKSFEKNPGLTEEAWNNAVAASKKSPIGNIGPDLFFCEYLAKKTGRHIGLVPCALGATSMSEWDPASKDQGDKSLYGNMMERIALVGGKIKGLIWYQGEGETGSPSTQENFEKNWLNFVDGVRRDTGIPDLPIIYVQISRYCLENQDSATGWEVIRDKQRRVASMRKNLFVVPAIDLPLDDLIHIGTAGHERLSRRMGEVALDKVYGLPGRATTIDYDSYEILPPIDQLHNKMRVHFKGVNGKLQAQGRPSGFEFKPENPNRDGPMVFKTELDPKDPSSVIVWYSKPITRPMKLYYGMGMNPYCNIVDSKDMAVPAFGPIMIEPKK